MAEGRKSGMWVGGERTLKLSDRSQLAMARANQEAIRLRHQHVGTEHILLGLLKEKGGAALRILAEIGPELDAIRTSVEAASPPGLEPVITSRPLPLTSRASKVIEYASQEARVGGRDTVGTADLLLGLLLQSSGVAAHVLKLLNIDVEKVRKIVGRLNQNVATPQQAQTATFVIHVDDQSSKSIYEQIVAAVQEAVATGELRGSDRMPTVRQLADQMDIAPGTVARAYSELERLGVIITDGARGTKVAQRARLSMPQTDRPELLQALLRPIVVNAFHLGASDEELKKALEAAMKDIFGKPENDAA